MADENHIKEESAKSNSNENPTNPIPNPNPNSNSNESEGLNLESSRTPFTNLSQVDADLALARTLQEQERAYMMLRMNGGERDNDYGSSDDEYVEDDDDDEESYEDDEEDDEEDDDQEDAFDAQEGDLNANLDPSAFTSDEAFARALQDAEDHELAARLMALSGSAFVHDDWDPEDDGTNSQDTWEEVDPDQLSYEELLALGEVVGTESRGLSVDNIASLPSISYKAQSSQDSGAEQCVICRLEYEDEETLTVLSCKHIYHPECINNWLQINKVCPVCSAEVSASDNR